jgi:hypothetical protein
MKIRLLIALQYIYKCLNIFRLLNNKVLEAQCNIIKSFPMTTMAEIQACKELSRNVADSAEKVFLFRYFLFTQDKIETGRTDDL